MVHRAGIDHPEIRWMVKFQYGLVPLAAALVLFSGHLEWTAPFLLGGLLATFNFTVLARIVPRLVFMRQGGVFSLLVSFYLRLIVTAGALFLAIAWARFSIPALLLGLSTVLISLTAWGGKFLLTHKHKEA
jgi:hypothetical protein